MKIFEAMKSLGHEELIFCYDKNSGLKAMIGIHDTSLGPALGGCRMWPYEQESDAILDVLRLSRGMTYKSAVAGSDYGGGKCVIWGCPETDKSEGKFKALGRFVETLKGRFITGTDVGTTAEDFVFSYAETSHLVALPEEYGGSGDSSVTTAFGVWQGIRAAAKAAFGSDDVSGKTVAVQGLGKVGEKLVGHLVEAGAKVVVTDITEDKVNQVCNKFAVESVDCQDIYDVDCDIFSPNALGGVLNDDTIPRLKCRAIAGGANNQLADEAKHIQMLQEKGILFAPDYVVNAGGLIQVSEELGGYDPERARRRTAAIYDTLLTIFDIAKEDNISTCRAADLMVERRLAELGQLRNILVP